MKNIYLILAIFITICIIFVSYYNNIPINLNFKCINYVLESNFQIVSLIIFTLGIISGICLMLKNISNKTEINSKYKKQLEKASVGQDETTLKVKALENKIQTLELALKKALESQKNN